MAGADSFVVNTGRLSPQTNHSCNTTHDNSPIISPSGEGKMDLPAQPIGSQPTAQTTQPISAPKPVKPTFTSRLSRMFSHRGENPIKEKDNESLGRTRASSNTAMAERPRNNSTAIVESPSVTPEPISGRPGPPQRTASSNGLLKNQKDTRDASTSSDRTAEVKKESKRFALHEDGTHEHTLRNDRRQEKLTTMFAKLLGGKKDKEVHHEDNQLSLVSSWIDQLKNEKVASDQKGGPNYATTLVEKYGKCQEVVGRGAFGIVRISHKPDATGKEQLYAVKEFRRRPQESPKKYNKRLTSEFCISSALRHPNVIHTLDLVKDAKGDFCEVMEFCAGGDLYTLVLAAGKLEMLEADCFFKQLMRSTLR